MNIFKFYSCLFSFTSIFSSNFIQRVNNFFKPKTPSYKSANDIALPRKTKIPVMTMEEFLEPKIPRMTMEQFEQPRNQYSIPQMSMSQLSPGNNVPVINMSQVNSNYASVNDSMLPPIKRQRRVF